jgi:hypothetical protein
MLKHFAIVLVSGATLGVTVQTGPGVPSILMAAAQRPPIEFGMMLAKTSVPAGIELLQADDVAPNQPMPRVDSDSRVPLDDVAKAFETYNPKYTARVFGGVLVIRPKEGAFPFLDAPSSISGPTAVTGVRAAQRRVFSELSPGLLGPVLNSYGRPGEDIPIVLDGSGGRRVVDTLNQIAAQAPGWVWWVSVKHREDTAVDQVSFGVLDPTGRSTMWFELRRPATALPSRKLQN